ncbi:MAG: hypothetical protein BroJett026_19750 [Betaproteobacteria bacterium]|nr:MAG: hypothetical protein BroJett026_19750 [Betaproteobacteria bacterium]
MRHSAPTDTVVSRLPVTSPWENSKPCAAGIAPSAQATAAATPEGRNGVRRERRVMRVSPRVRTAVRARALSAGAAWRSVSW